MSREPVVAGDAANYLVMHRTASNDKEVFSPNVISAKGEKPWSEPLSFLICTITKCTPGSYPCPQVLDKAVLVCLKNLFF